MYFHGVVICRERRTAAVAITAEQHEHLLSGNLTCPCCQRLCGPSFRSEHSTASPVSWNGAGWGLAAVAHER
jgi:hypothetical protein